MQNTPVDNSTRPFARHSWSSTHLLKQWYTSNFAWPYPSAEEKKELSRRTGLSVRQISQWFVNMRRRDAGRQRSETFDSANRMSSSAPTSFHPIQEQTESIKAINHRHRSSASGAIPQFLTEDDLAGIDSQGEALTNASVLSSSYSSSHSRDSDRPHRHNYKEQHAILSHTAIDGPAEDNGSRIYQCTFCTDTFKSRYDWTRHEGTLHLALERWACLPTGPKRWDSGEAVPKCSLCDLSDPTDAHLETHHIYDCVMKPMPLRTFHRKDHLHQHLRLAHGIDKMVPSMNYWSSKICQIKSRCGFCGETFYLWPDRNNHLVDHFRRGKSMKDWKGDRGLEPSVAMLVQSAMPPYLIGVESLDLEPFSASRGVLKKSLLSPETKSHPNVFEVLTARLGGFVASAHENGDTINCDLLRRQARIILYGDDDPSNKTPADNEQWLTFFKIGHGLASEPIRQPSEHLSVDAPNLKISTPVQPIPNNPAPLSTAARSKSKSNLTARLLHDGFESELPWWCQTPECLAELMQMSQEFSLTSLGNIRVDDGSTVDS